MIQSKMKAQKPVIASIDDYYWEQVSTFMMESKMKAAQPILANFPTKTGGKTASKTNVWHSTDTKNKYIS